MKLYGGELREVWYFFTRSSEESCVEGDYLVVCAAVSGTL